MSIIEYVNTLFGSLFSQYTENKQITLLDGKVVIMRR